MIQSMTGYGAHTVSSENFNITVELKSLNSKFTEINLKLPKQYLKHELALRNYLNHFLKRGKINAVMEVEVLNPDKNQLRINLELVKAYTRELDSLRQSLGLDQSVSMEFILNLPNAFHSDDVEADEEEWNLIEICFQQAAQFLMDSRNEEGKALERDMRIRLDLIARQIDEIEILLPNRIENIRNRIMQSLTDIQERMTVDVNRFEQELIYYIERLDVNEEIVRLRKHIDFFNMTLAEDESNGKKLGFISQEMGREINTIGSKANDADIQIYVVRMKEELEKIKEQLQNIV